MCMKVEMRIIIIELIINYQSLILSVTIAALVATDIFQYISIYESKLTIILKILTIKIQLSVAIIYFLTI